MYFTIFPTPTIIKNLHDETPILKSYTETTTITNRTNENLELLKKVRAHPRQKRKTTIDVWPSYTNKHIK